MLLYIDDEVSESLKKLSSFPIEVVKEFCAVSVECIFKESYTKLFSSAASKLGVETECVKRIIESLMMLYIESAKQHLTDQGMQLTLKTLEFPKDYESTISEEYFKSESRIKEMLMDRGPPLRYYNDCRWRLDVKLASRSLHQQIEPKIMLKLQTATPNNNNNDNNVANNVANNVETFLLQTDPTSLIHVTRCLEEALKDVQNPPTYYKRLTKNL